MIDPQIWDSAFGKRWSCHATLTFISAISAADDEGRGRISSIYRNIEAMLSKEEFDKAILEIGDSIQCYDEYLYSIPKWLTYQRIDKAATSLFPLPPEYHSKNDSKNDSCTREVKRSKEKRREELLLIESDFDTIWKAYPRKANKVAAVRAFEKAIRNGADIKAILTGVVNYASSCEAKGTEPEYIAHPSTFLNQRRWEDWQEVEKPQERKSKFDQEVEKAKLHEQRKADFMAGKTEEKPWEKNNAV